MRDRNAATRRRAAFTLLELMLVLTVVLVVAAMAAPLVRRSFAYQSLRSGADQVRASFGQARIRAIKSGNVFAFLYAQGGESYTISPFINAYSLINPQIMASVQSPPPLRKLPAGLVFAGANVSGDARGQFESEGASGTQGMTPILFYPDGSSQDAAVYLRNDRNDLIRVDLRGLTGMSNVARVSDQGQ